MLSVIIPVYNESETLPVVFDRLSRQLDTMSIDYEVLFINDGSIDGTAALLELQHNRDKRWRFVSFSRNFGHQAAVSAGLEYCRGDAVAIMDADLQDPPEVLPQLLDKWREGYDVVYAVRRKRKEGPLKRVAYTLFYRILRWSAAIEIPLDTGDFCVMDRRVVDVINSMPERSRFVRGLRSWAGFRQTGVEYERQSRHAGEVKYNFRKLVELALNGIVSFSNAPLRLASWLGISLCGLSGLAVLLLLLWWASGAHFLGMHPRDSVGWTSLVCAMLLLSGVQMLLIGVLGEYLSRVFEEVKQRPLWVVSRSRGVEMREDSADRRHSSQAASTTLISADPVAGMRFPPPGPSATT